MTRCTAAGRFPASGGLAARSCQALSDRAASQFLAKRQPRHYAQFAAQSRKYLAPTYNTFSRVRLKPTVICKTMLWSPSSEVAPGSAGGDLSNLHARCSLYARRHDRLSGSVSSNVSHGEERRRPLAPHERRAGLPSRADSAPHFLPRGLPLGYQLLGLG